MKIAGIVAEYNPFHNGHAYHIEHTRARHEGEATHIVAVMSGNFVQRGEPALLGKSARVRMALAGGVDLVLELPLPWSLCSAEGFAFGGVSLLHTLGCVDMLSFGSECGDIAPLVKVVDLLENPRFSALLQGRLQQGLSFPDARRRAAAEMGGEATASLLDTPNNTLGIEYLKALRRLGSSIQPYTMRRMGAEHDELAPLGTIASASYLRMLVHAGRTVNAANYLPYESSRLLAAEASAGRCPADARLMERAVLAQLRRMDATRLRQLPDINEGLENRLYNAIRQASSLEELIALTKTKRYTQTRVQRLIWSAFLGVPAGFAGQQPPYARVLGANERGMEIMRAAHAGGCTLPLLSRTAQVASLPSEAQELFALECRAGDMYALALPKPLPCGSEQTAGMIKTES